MPIIPILQKRMGKWFARQLSDLIDIYAIRNAIDGHGKIELDDFVRQLLGNGDYCIASAVFQIISPRCHQIIVSCAAGGITRAGDELNFPVHSRHSEGRPCGKVKMVAARQENGWAPRSDGCRKAWDVQRQIDGAIRDTPW
ncbi:MAG: hypothetical protein QHC67_02390 [Sphingobium sp.]|nr:hypothetical protein [Sphingobium sp.]MDX3908647.1 hypothetical protein [Sphingobium sp.]